MHIKCIMCIVQRCNGALTVGDTWEQNGDRVPNVTVQMKN